MKIFSDNLADREAAACDYQRFSHEVHVPAKFQQYWKVQSELGKPWPVAMQQFADPTIWPEHAFGTANAAVVIFWHRPGLGALNNPAGAYIGPRFPVLGGNGHAHVKHWLNHHGSNSWKLLHKYLPMSFEGAGLSDVWSQVMVACVNPIPGPTGTVDHEANKRGAAPGGAMDIVVKLCRPRLVLLCGNQVAKVSTVFQEYHPELKTLEVPHPSTWDGYANPSMLGSDVVAKVRQYLGLHSSIPEVTRKPVTARIRSANGKPRDKVNASENDFTDMIGSIETEFLRAFVENLNTEVPADCDLNRAKDMWVIKYLRKTLVEIHPRKDHLLIAIRKPRQGDPNEIRMCGELQADRSRTVSHPYISFRVRSKNHLEGTKLLIKRLVDRER